MPKKPVLFAIIGVVALVLIGGGVWFWKAQSAKTDVVEDVKPTKKRIVEPVNVIPVAERPVMYITPQADGHNLDIVVAEVKKEADMAEFEIEYTTENLVQGGQGEFELGSLPAMKKWFMGSCSAGGACSYHENVTGGSLKTRFVGPENYAIKHDWRYIENTDRSDTFASKDGKFQLAADSFTKVGLAVVTNSPGYPEGLKGEPASEAYVVKTPSTLSGEATVSIRTTGDAKIMAWDGSDWSEMETTMSDSEATATGPVADLYIAVAQ